MALHFSRSEFSDRLTRILRELERRDLDGIILFAQESMYWLTGYDTFGFCFFQALYVRSDGEMSLLTRSADLRQAQQTSIIDDIHIWRDAKDSRPAWDLAELVRANGGAGKRLGVEYDTHGLTYAAGRSLQDAFEGLAQLIDVSDLVPRLRAVKSVEEIAIVRKAAESSDKADLAALHAIHVGADEGEILAAQQAAIFAGGGDYPGNEFIIGSGRDALLCRYKAGRRKLDANDQITLEFAGCFRHYHAAIMRTVVVGEPRPLHREYHRIAREALHACEDAMRPGATAADIFQAHARVFDANGASAHP